MKTNTKLRGTQLLSIILLIILLPACSTKKDFKNGLSQVDPKIGGVGLLLQPTRPTVQMPNQMIRMYPVRKDYIDDQIQYFPLSIISHRLGELFGLMPFTGKLTSGAPVSSWDEGLEVSTPYYFSTWLQDYSVTVEFSPGEKAGYFRFTFPDKVVKNIFLENINKDKWKLSENNTILTEESFNGMKAYVFGVFNEKPTMNSEAVSATIGNYLSWDESTPNVIDFKYAISYINTEHAQRSLAEEIPDWSFGNLKESAKVAWENIFNQIQVKGGSEKHRRTFYTALYRCFERMVNITESGEYYSNYDSLVHK